MAKNTLIIRSNSNNFEHFVTDKIQEIGFDTAEPYLKPIHSMSMLQLLRFRSRIPKLYADLIGNWKAKLSEYECVIIFDNALTIQLVKYIHQYHPHCHIKIWLWNICKINSKEYSRYAEIYTFDKNFAIKNNYKYIPQFYFKIVPEPIKEEHGIFFIGYDKNRFDFLKEFILLLNSKKINHYAILRMAPGIVYTECEDIVLVKEDVDYIDIIKYIRHYSCLLELNPEGQEGLTLRTLEALFFSKKLITTNKNIKCFKFYNPANIFIIGIDDYNSLPEFISSKYEKIDPLLLNEYTFENWINNISER